MSQKLCMELLFFSLVFICVCVFNAWSKGTLLLLMWPRDVKSLNTHTPINGRSTLSLANASTGLLAETGPLINWSHRRDMNSSRSSLYLTQNDPFYVSMAKAFFLTISQVTCTRSRQRILNVYKATKYQPHPHKIRKQEKKACKQRITTTKTWGFLSSRFKPFATFYTFIHQI